MAQGNIKKKGPYHVPLKKYYDMTQRRKTSYASTPGPPDGSMPAVHNNREESLSSTSRVKRDEGRHKRPDCAHLKTGNNTLKIGTWNVITLTHLGKLDNLRQEAESMDIDIMGILEARYTGEGIEPLGSYNFIFSGGEQHENGVGFLMKSTTVWINI